MHVFEFAWISLALLCSTLNKDTGMPKNYVLTFVNKVDLKDITLSRLCSHLSESTLHYVLFIMCIYVYIYILINKLSKVSVINLYLIFYLSC